ncbi:3'(2'),5'-bisphosphate nucleotidase CysQ [Xanthobacter sp. V3C-3]|uniref:3'(2'),5'-bisphosphate nucleotidase CysQ n=1 Tax=Xanthobacter lutulentifluminis TaxID=3119935 RepID=UPI00372A03CE
MSVETTSGRGDPGTAAPVLATPHPASAETAALARRLVDVVAEAGEMALSMSRAGVRSWTKGNDSPVTEADMAVDAFLRRSLEALDPAIGWLSEESADTPARLAVRRVWVVDPIDGTRAFMAGGPDWAVSAALVEDGRPVAAALFAPVTQEMFTALAGHGAQRNGTRLAAPPRGGLAGARVAGPPSDMDAIARVAPVERLPRIRSLALRLARVATGEIDLALSAGNSADWDLAAADLVVHEAAARLTTRAGAHLIYNRADPRHPALVCAGDALHAATLAAPQLSDFFSP